MCAVAHRHKQLCHGSGAVCKAHMPKLCFWSTSLFSCFLPRHLLIWNDFSRHKNVMWNVSFCCRLNKHRIIISSSLVLLLLTARVFVYSAMWMHNQCSHIILKIYFFIYLKMKLEAMFSGQVNGLLFIINLLEKNTPNNFYANTIR